MKQNTKNGFFKKFADAVKVKNMEIPKVKNMEIEKYRT